MKNLIIAPTSSTPAINFRKEGRLLIEGRSLPEDTAKFFSPLIDFARHITATEVKVVVKLEYLNSSSTKKLLELLNVLDVNRQINSLSVEWFFEEEDEDILENGQIFEELLRKAMFRYHEIKIAA